MLHSMTQWVRANQTPISNVQSKPERLACYTYYGIALPWGRGWYQHRWRQYALLKKTILHHAGFRRNIHLKCPACSQHYKRVVSMIRFSQPPLNFASPSLAANWPVDEAKWPIQKRIRRHCYFTSKAWDGNRPDVNWTLHQSTWSVNIAEFYGLWSRSMHYSVLLFRIWEDDHRGFGNILKLAVCWHERN